MLKKRELLVGIGVVLLSSQSGISDQKLVQITLWSRSNTLTINVKINSEAWNDLYSTGREHLAGIEDQLLTILGFEGALKRPYMTCWVPSTGEEEVQLVRVEVKRKHSPSKLPFLKSEEAMVDLASFTSQAEAELSHPVKLGVPGYFRGITLYPLTIYPLLKEEGEERWSLVEEVEVELKGAADEQGLSERVSRFSAEGCLIARALLGEQLAPLNWEGRVHSHRGFYLVVSREELLPFAIPLLEWKRQLGFKVEVLTYGSGVRAEEIKADLQNRYDQLRESGEEPFDYILILGDRAGNPNVGPYTLPSFQGRPTMREFPNHADFLYGLLEGGEDDPIPDVGVGRMGSGSELRMRMAVARTLAYEQALYREDRSWFSRAGVFSQRWGEDWNFSLILTTRWGERVLERSGFREILIQETDGGEDGQGRLVAQALSQWLNQSPPSLLIGRAQIDYWHDSLIGVNAGRVFPIGINFTGHGEFTMNTLFNSGSMDSLKGVAAWTTGWGTPQTLYSNGVWMAMVQGLLVHRLSLGGMRVYAGAMLVGLFPDQEEVWWTYQTDLDLYGDPGLKPWIGEPRELEVEVPDTIPQGARSLEVRVREEESGLPVKGALVALYVPGDMPEPEDYARWTPIFQEVGWTDPTGHIILPLPSDLPSGVMLLTVTQDGYYPYWQEVIIQRGRGGVTISRIHINDNDGGNGDGVLNPGEEVGAYLYALNLGEDDIEILNAEIILSSPGIEMLDSSLTWEHLGAGEEVRSLEPLRFRVKPEAEDGKGHYTDLTWDWPIESRERIWWDVQSPRVEIFTASIDTTGELQIVLSNLGRMRSPASLAFLSSSSWAVRAQPDTLYFPSIASGGRGGAENGGRFRLEFHPLSFPGLRIPLTLHLLSLQGGWKANIPIVIEHPGRLTGRLPGGPDDYGYIAIDNTDTSWSGAPIYRWFEITPAGSGGERNGTRLPLEQSPYGRAVVVDLPFPLRFYGEEFSQITVCTNGFITPGRQERNVNYQNWDLSHAIGGGMGMIAPFWDNLNIDLGDRVKGVYTYYDTSESRFVVEWYRVKVRGDNREQTFQVIIYDFRSQPTPTGDSPLLFQYASITPVEGNNPGDVPYMSVGISSPDGRTGVGYLHSQRDNPTSAPLTGGRAILWTTLPSRVSHQARIEGTVLSRSHRQPLPDVHLSLDAVGLGALMEGLTDGEGQTLLTDLPLGHYRLTVNKEGYNPQIQWVTITPDTTIRVEFLLSRPIIATDRDTIKEYLQPNHTTQRSFTLRNEGDGPLTWEISFRDGVRDSTIHWLRLFNSPSRGVLEAGDSLMIIFRMQTSGLDNGDHWGRIVIASPPAQTSATIWIYLNIDPTNEAGGNPELLPTAWEVDYPAPNPFNGISYLPISLPLASEVTVTLFDREGRWIGVKRWNQLPAGRHHLSLNLSQLPAGVYLGQVKVGEMRKMVKLVLLK